MAELTKIVAKPTLTTAQKVTTGSAVLLSILAIVMSSGLLNQQNVYACENLNLAMQCDSLSGINADGLQTRCYFTSEELKRETYKSCKTGWLKYTPSVAEKVVSKIDNVSNSVPSNESSICRVINKNNLIKECVNDKDETYLYMVRF